MLLQERIKDFAFIDKRKSKIDSKKSNPELGLFFFDSDKKVKYKIKDSGKVSDYWYHWIHKEEYRISSVRAVRGYDFVTKDDDVVPEGLKVNTEGHYQIGDLILMKCPLEQFLKRKLAARARSQADLQATLNKFKSSTRTEGADMEESMINDLLGELTKVN